MNLTVPPLAWAPAPALSKWLQRKPRARKNNNFRNSAEQPERKEHVNKTPNY